MSYRRYRPIAWANIDGSTVPLTAFDFTFENNAIPFGNIVLPLGRRGGSKSLSKIHDLLSKVNKRTRCIVYLKFADIDGVTHARRHGSDQGKFVKLNDLGFEEGKIYRIFDGITIGDSRACDVGSASYIVPLLHRLTLLNNSSSISETSMPSNPGSFSWGGLCPTIEGSNRSMTAITEVARFATPANMLADVWGKALFPFLKSVTNQDRFYIARSPVGAIFGGPTGNKGAAEGLMLLDAGKTKLAKPIPFFQGTLLNLLDNLTRDLSDSFRDCSSLAHVTLWDAMVRGLFGNLCLALSPRCRNGVVVPYDPMRKKPEMTFYTEEIKSVEAISGGSSLVRATALYGWTEGQGGLAAPVPMDNVTPEFASIAGWYQGQDEGMIAIEMAPRWARAIIPPPLYSYDSVGGGQGAIATAILPYNETLAAIAAAAEKAIREMANTYKSRATMLDNLARYRLLDAAFGVRQSVVTTPFRLDTAPGTKVFVESSMGEGGAVIPGFFGHVARVTIAMDAEASKASAAFHVTHTHGAADAKGPFKLDGLPDALHPFVTPVPFSPSLIDEEAIYDNEPAVTNPTQGLDVS